MVTASCARLPCCFPDAAGRLVLPNLGDGQNGGFTANTANTGCRQIQAWYDLRCPCRAGHFLLRFADTTTSFPRRRRSTRALLQRRSAGIRVIVTFGDTRMCPLPSVAARIMAQFGTNTFLLKPCVKTTTVSSSTSTLKACSVANPTNENTEDSQPGPSAKADATTPVKHPENLRAQPYVVPAHAATSVSELLD